MINKSAYHRQSELQKASGSLLPQTGPKAGSSHSSQMKNRQASQNIRRPIRYFYDMHDPHEYFESIKNRSYNMTSFSGYTNFPTSASSNYSENNNECQLKWYDNPEWQGKLIYKVEKSIPAVVQRILEEMGFIEWDEKEHEPDQWNLLWKSQR